MLQDFTARHHTDPNNGAPAGGCVQAKGLHIDWQDGQLGKVGSDERAEPNGCFVETVIAVAVDRLEYYQASKFACQENETAIHDLKDALRVLNARTERRIEAGVEGTHEGN